MNRNVACANGISEGKLIVNEAEESLNLAKNFG